MVNFPTRNPDCDYLFLLMLVFVLQWLSLLLDILNMWLSHFPLTFSQTQKGNALFHHIAYGYSCADWNGLCYHLRDVSMDNIFKLSASATASQ